MERACREYIAAVCIPDASFAFSTGSQATKPETKDIKRLNKVIDIFLDTSSNGLQYVPLELDSLAMEVFVDVGFAANPDSSSQLGFIITLMDPNER